jgi:hypothetical protein
MPINERIDTALLLVYQQQPFLQADLAREYDMEIAMLASMGLISTRTTHTEFGRRWRVTGIGIDVMKSEGLL